MYSRILVALDGSEYADVGGEVALALARGKDCSLTACHIYDARLHSKRFRDMEPVLPPQYQDEMTIREVRDAHGGLISEGFEALSKGYVEPYVARVKHDGNRIMPVYREGRNYVRLLQVAEEEQADVILLGAHGLGDIQDGYLGSTATRILKMARCDVLIARRRAGKGKIIVGIDGSDQALEALRKAAFWARTLSRPIQLVSVFDPKFHNQIFRTMASSFPKERQEEIGLATQETLHEEMINKGLGKLYQGFLDHAFERSREWGVEAECILLQGKIYRALVEHAKRENAWMVVMGRRGHHYSGFGDVGSNCEAVCRLTETNVLVTRSIQSSPRGA
jgi:nucleotide-binding universal stress UspA family protein